MSNIRVFRLKRILAAVLIALVCAAAFPVIRGETANAASLDASGKIKVSTLNLRKSWKTSSKCVGKLKKKPVVTVSCEVFTTKNSTSSSKRWYAVSTGSKSGYVLSSRVTIRSWANVPAYTTDGVNYRKGPATSFKKVGTVKAGTKVTILLPAKRPGGAIWYKVNVNGKTGYMHSDYVSIGSPEQKIETGTPSNFTNTFNNIVNAIQGTPASKLNEKATNGGNARIVYTFDTGNCTPLFAITGSGDAQVPQAFTFTGSEYYVLFGMDNAQCIITYSADGRRLKVTPFPSNYGHLNGITWDPETRLCYIFKGSQYEIYTWDPATDAFGTATTLYSSSGVAYDNTTRRLYASSTSCVRIYSADGNFSYLGKINRCDAVIDHHVQDCGAYNGFIFHGITSRSDRFHNYLDVYRARDGRYLGSIKVTMDEIESAVVGPDGYLQLLINNNTRTDYVWKTPLNVNDLK